MNITRRNFILVGSAAGGTMLLGGWKSCGTAQTWLQLAEQDLPVLAEQAANIISLVAPAEGALVKVIVDAAVTAVGVVTDAVNAYNANPNNTTLQNVVNAINKAAVDLPQVLASAHITDPTTLAAVTAAVDLIVTTLDIIAANIPGQPASIKHARSTRMKAAGTVGVKIPTAAQLRQQWNKQVCTKAKTCKAM